MADATVTTIVSATDLRTAQNCPARNDRCQSPGHCYRNGGQCSTLGA